MSNERLARLILAGFIVLASLTACVPTTPLHEAAGRGNTQQVLALLDRGMDVDVRQDLGLTPLHYAAMHGQPDTARVLLDRGAEIDATPYTTQRTPLYLAAKAGELSVVQLLVERGADVTIKGHPGRHPFETPQSPAEVAEANGHTAVVQYLREVEPRAARRKPAPASNSSTSGTAPVPRPAETPPPIY